MSATDLGSKNRPLCQRICDACKSKPKQQRNLNEISRNNKEQKLDENFGKILEKWSHQQNAMEKEKEKSVSLLKAQLERYELEMALRKLRKRQQSQKSTRPLASTDDKLPYEQKPISTNWSVALKRMQAFQRNGQILLPQPHPPVDTQPMDTHDQPEDIPQDVAVDGQIPTPPTSPTQSSSPPAATNFSSTATTSETISEDTPYHPLTSTDTNPTKDTQPSPMTEESYSDSEEYEKACHLTDLLMEIMKDAQHSDEGKPKETTPHCSNADLAACSRNDIVRFEHIILENTKQSLLSSQPTEQEERNWAMGHADSRNVDYGHKINFSKEQVEIRKFCPLCSPRHWNKACSCNT